MQDIFNLIYFSNSQKLVSLLSYRLIKDNKKMITTLIDEDQSLTIAEYIKKDVSMNVLFLYNTPQN